uniref:costunolide synthase-like n=1 Tax=Erigeron canadensis TaxID=72917 RepID=UPI001CB9D657|nr:costunolide synthase-like [Erigeron canadensis]
MDFFTILSLVASSLILYTSWVLIKTKTSKNLPPGPPKLPIIGNLHQVKSTTLTPYRVLRNLANKYGPIMHLQLGQVSTVVISTPRLAKEVLNATVSSIADRPVTTTSQIFYYRAQDIGWTLYGPYWIQMRKICVSELLSAKRVQSFGNLQADELKSTCKLLESSLGTTVNFRQIMTQTVNNVICRATLGDIYKDRTDLVELLTEVMNGLGDIDVVSYFPSFQFLYNISGKKAKWLKTHKQLDIILEEILNEHRKRTSINQDHEDLLEVLLRIKETGDLDVPITNENVKAVVLDLLIAGMGTPTSVIEWAMSELMKNPETMKRAQAEVRAVLKGNTITETDIRSMHYLKLVIKETLRLHSPPLLVPRVTKKHFNIDGYDIPANTNLLVNVWACETDPDSWENPESFIPERFENSPINYLGSDFQFIPFGAGKRICAGMTFGLNMVEHVVATFLYHFDWKLPNGLKPDEVDMTEVYGASVLPKYPLQIVPVSVSLAN